MPRFQFKIVENLFVDKSCLDKIVGELKKHEVIPDVIETAFQENLAVSYPKSNTKAELGNELTPTNVRQKPELSWNAEEGTSTRVP